MVQQETVVHACCYTSLQVGASMGQAASNEPRIITCDGSLRGDSGLIGGSKLSSCAAGTQVSLPFGKVI